MFAEDRNHEVAAAAVITTLFSPSLRRLCLELLANSIDKAHSANPKSWGVTLFPDLVRLNIGMVEGCVLSHNKVYLTLLRPYLTEHTLQNELLNFNMYNSEIQTGVYKSVPESMGCSFDSRHVSEVLDLLLPAHNGLIQQAAHTRRHSKTRGAHSPGILKYLRSELKRVIPEPVYTYV